MAETPAFTARHPFLTGFIFMSMFGAVFFVGISFLITKIASQTTDPFTTRTTDGIGIIDVKGMITNTEGILRDIQRFRAEETIRAVVIRIDSPGGAVGASQELYSEIKRLGRDKPVVASLGSVAASGGFYAAIGADKIVASPGTLTGSMGVIMKFPNLEEIFKKIGYKSETIKSGKFKDIGASNRTVTLEERALLQDIIDTVHHQFINDIAESRALSVEEVTKIADGRIFSGEQARDLGLIDELGNFHDAVLLAAELAEMDTTTFPELVYPPQDTVGIISSLLSSAELTLLGKLQQLQPQLAYEWNGSVSLATQ
jgi:protease-4